MPKWDGFRALAFRDGRDVEIQSRHGRPFARYFPELTDALRALPEHRFAVDGEIVVAGPAGFDFPALMARLHPSASRVERFREETPVSFLAFDLVALDDEDLRPVPFVGRRTLLERLLAGAERPLLLTPVTDDVDVAAQWLERHTGAAIDGVVAKRRDLPYEPARTRRRKRDASGRTRRRRAAARAPAAGAARTRPRPPCPVPEP